MARVALLLLLAFTLFRGLLLGVTTPPFWGPDEDYHFLYADYLVTQHALIGPDKPLYTREYRSIADLVDYESYCCRKTDRFHGDPKASVERLERLGSGARKPTETGRGVGVVHPPLYHLAAAAVDWTLGDASILTRATWLRFLSAVFGTLAIYAAWLLAAQVFASARLQLLTAFVVALQPMMAYLAGIVNHDSLLIAFATAALAMMAFLVRTRPRVAQGAWLAGPVVGALWVKGSALALLPVAALAFAAQALTWPGERRAVLKSAGVMLGLTVLLAAPWYIHAALAYGSATGATTAISDSGPTGLVGSSLGDLFNNAKEWTGITYRTYWWHYNPPETPGASPSKFIPALAGAIAMLGLARLIWTRARSLFDPADALLRQCLLFVFTVLVFYLPFMAMDLARRADGHPFFLTGGRYLLPAFGGVAVLFVVGIGQLVRREAESLVLASAGAAALVFGAFVYGKYSLWHYIGLEAPGEILRRLSFNRAPFVTSGVLGVLAVFTVLSLVAFVVTVMRSPGPAAGASHYGDPT
jgi:4-amino-4-deoxy-L-arabinose transferase-like glycosyltransferase